MAIDKKNTGCFARSRFGFPSFAESPKFARGSNSYDLSWRLEYASARRGIGAPVPFAYAEWMQSAFSDHAGLDKFYPTQPNGPTDQDYQDWTSADIYLRQDFANATTFQKGLLLITNKTYLPGIYDITIDYPHNMVTLVNINRANYPDRDYIDYSASLIAVDNSQEIQISPANIATGLDSPLKPGILSAAYYPNRATQFDGIFYGVDMRVNTRLLFGRTTQFKVKQVIFKTFDNPSGVCTGRSVLV